MSRKIGCGRAAELFDLASKVPGVVELQVEPQVEIPQVLVTIERDEAARYGVTVEEVARTLETALKGKMPTCGMKVAMFGKKGGEKKDHEHGHHGAGRRFVPEESAAPVSIGGGRSHLPKEGSCRRKRSNPVGGMSVTAESAAAEERRGGDQKGAKIRARSISSPGKRSVSSRSAFAKSRSAAMAPSVKCVARTVSASSTVQSSSVPFSA